MKKILFLVNTHKPDYDLFVQAGKELGTEVVVATFSEISFHRNEKMSIKVQKHALESFSVVYFRVIVRNHELTSILIQFCLQHDVAIEDEGLKTNIVYSKLYDQILFEKNGLPTIKTVGISPENFRSQLGTFSFPLVVKVTDASQGRGVLLCHSLLEVEQSFDQLEKQLLLAQEYIPNSGDLRIIVIGNTTIGAIKRVTTTSNEFRNNVSLGGSAEKFELTDEIREIALRSAQALNYGLAGVDLIFDDSQKSWKIMEVNRAPQLNGFMNTHAINVPKLFIKYLLQKYS